MQDLKKTRTFEVSKKDPLFIERKQQIIHSLKSAILPDRKINKVTQLYQNLQVPVIRLFGITKRGQKACVNVFDTIFNLEAATKEELTLFLQTLAQNLEFALYLVINNKPGIRSPRAMYGEFKEKNDQYVHNIEVVHRYPIYGYHSEKKPFLKIELYDPRNIKKASQILQKGVIFGGIAMQPYEAHLSYHMHFYGDYNLSGMDFVKITDFHVRHLDTFDDDVKNQTLSSKSFYPFEKFAIASLKQDQQASELIEIQSVDSRLSQNQFPGFKVTHQQSYEFLQKDNYLRLWHADMPEVQDITEQIISPYARSSSCQIEVDCSCKDILNIWETDQNIIGGGSTLQDPRNSELYKRSQDSHVDDSFAENYITPFKTPIPRNSIRQNNTIGNSEMQIQNGPQSQYSIRTVFLDQQEIMKIQIDPINRQRTENQIRDYSQSQLGRLNSIRQSCESFQSQSEESYHLAQPAQGILTPNFREEAKSEMSFDKEFCQYSEDIKEVRSLVNLWKEEFIRRKTSLKLPPLERAVMSDSNRQGGYSQSILSKDLVKIQLMKNLNTKYSEIIYDSVNNELYKQLDPIHFKALQVLLQQKELDNGDDGGLERFQMLGFGTMRQLHEARHGKAVMKNLQQQISSGEDGEEQDTAEQTDNNEINVDVLDIMDSLKDQFEGLQQKYQTYREGKSKYKTGKLATDINNNKSIFDYMSPKSKKKESRLVTIEEEKSGEEETNQKHQNVEESITLTELALLDDSNTLQLLDLQEALLSIQNSEVINLQNHLTLEEVKEEESCEENSYMSEMASLLSAQIQQDAPPQKNSQVKHYLKGDKIQSLGSPRRPLPDDVKHQKAFFSMKEDLLTHLNEIRRIRNNKKLQLKDMKIDLHEVNKQELEIDLRIQKDPSILNKVGNNIYKYKHLAPKSSFIRQQYQSKDAKIQYERQLCNFEINYFNEKITDKDKIQVKQDIIQDTKKDHRFVTPATQYDLKYLDSQVNVGGFEKRRELEDNPSIKMSLYDIHKEFDEIFGLTVMVIEVMVCNRPGMVPNYEIDPIAGVYFSIHNECAELNLKKQYQLLNGVILNKQCLRSVGNFKLGSFHSLTEEIYARNEINLLQRVIDIFREYDPDIIVGYETETQSIGYICKRGETLQIQMSSMLSRTPVSMKPLNESFYNQRKIIKDNEIGSVDDQLPGRDSQKKKFGFFQQKWGQAVKLSGRVIINLWRLIKSEINLTNYDLDNVCYHILKKREPRFDYDTLTNWWQKGQYYHVTNAVLKKLHNMFYILDTMNFIHRDMNMANVYGIDYESVMTRGSQFRVEAILSRITKSQGFALLSASPQQVFEQQELEVIPLVIEPDKMFYTDPVIIVDFQSLYPSIIIAYNLCYSTCLGKLVSVNQDNYCPTRKLGVYIIPASIKTFFGFKADQQLTEEQEKYIMDSIIVAPNLNCFVKPHLRQGILPLMLREILYTRIMVKKSMKLYEPGSTTYRMLDSRQLALKLIANVTYGYTAAGFSGRMPCCELADSVVSLGRMTVEHAIGLINQQEDVQGTRVVYGDTDSIFILCQGRTLEQAFKIGDQIAKHITSINPFPMELKFEKVYYPCVTLAKKRYCGFKMEKITDQRVLDAKGIETIRRDTVDAVQKIMDKCLRLLFTNKDLSQVKDYLIRQWSKIIQGHVDFKDFIFAKEVKYGMYRSMPPGAIVVERRLQNDPGALPRYHERIPYVVVMGQGGAIDQSKIKDLVLSPEEFLARDGLMLNAPYYIKKQINPALNRIFLEIFDIDVNSWYDKMPKRQREQGTQSKKVQYFTQKISSSKSVISQSKISTTSSIAGQNSMMIDQFYQKKCCLVCGSDELLNNSKLICKQCVNNMRSTQFIMQSRLKNVENAMNQINFTCLACSNMLLKGRLAKMIDIEDTAGALNVVPCLAYQCTIFHQKLAIFKEYQNTKEVIKKLNLDLI